MKERLWYKRKEGIAIYLEHEPVVALGRLNFMPTALNI